LLSRLFIEKYGSLDSFDNYLRICNKSYAKILISSIKGGEYFSKFNGEVVVIVLHSATCTACIKLLEIMIKLEKKFQSQKNVVFMNLFYNNKPKLPYGSIYSDRKLYSSMVEGLNVNGVPYILIIDGEGYIRYKMAGLKRDKDYFKDMEHLIRVLAR
jgi:thiol-disulfide isomerase/thioredoxin